MSQENVEVVRRGYERLRSGRPRRPPRALHPDFEFGHRGLQDAGGRLSTGHEGFRRLVELSWLGCLRATCVVEARKSSLTRGVTASSWCAGTGSGQGLAVPTVEMHYTPSGR